MKSVVYGMSVIVFAPNFPANTTAEERGQELKKAIHRCKDDGPFHKALDSDVGRQIVAVATSKMEQLEKTMKTSASLADLWNKVKSGDSSSSLLEVEALVQTTDERTAREVIMPEDLEQLRAVIVAEFLQHFFPPETDGLDDKAFGEAMWSWAGGDVDAPGGKFQVETMETVIFNCSQVAACKSMLALYEITEARDCFWVVVVVVPRP